MKRKKSIRMLLCVALSIFVVGYLAATAEAVPITYIFGGSNSAWDYTDTLGNVTEINNVSFRIYLSGDTGTIDTTTDPGAPFNPVVSGTVFVWGATTYLKGIFTVPLEVFVLQADEIIGLGDSFLIADLFDVGSSGTGLLTYLLEAPFGPIPGFVTWAGDFVLDIGTLAFADSGLGGEAFFAAEPGDTTPAAVPEPVSMLLLGFGLLGVSALRRRLS